MKDEFKVKIINEFIGLKSKMHSISLNNEEVKKAKGVNKNIVKKIRHKDLSMFCLIKKMIRHKMKISLSCFNDKRYVLDDGINSLAYFHKDTKTNKIGYSR